MEPQVDEVKPERLEDVPTRTLVEELLWHLGRIVRDESRKARVHVKEGAKYAFGGSLLATMGGALALVGGLILALDAVYLLSYVMPLWVSGLIIGAGLAMVGGLLTYGAASELKKAAKQASEVKKALTEDAEWAQEIFHQAKKHHADA